MNTAAFADAAITALIIAVALLVFAWVISGLAALASGIEEGEE